MQELCAVCSVQKRARNKEYCMFIVYVCLTYRIEMLVCLLIFKCLISSINFEPNKKPRISKTNALVAIAISNQKLIDIWRLKSETKMRKRRNFRKAKLSFDFIHSHL